jgi:hypothetical protein
VSELKFTGEVRTSGFLALFKAIPGKQLIRGGLSMMIQTSTNTVGTLRSGVVLNNNPYPSF